MPKDGSATRSKIMDVAQQMVLDVGLSGTSVEKVIEKAGVTKGTFFYHFKTKHQLAEALLERYATEDREHFGAFMLMAQQLSRDPLQQLLIFVGLFVEMTEKLEEPFPGCLYASYCYQSGAISLDMLSTMKDMTHYWREKLSHLIARISEDYPACIPVEPSQVADHVLTTFEGAFILAKIMDEPKLASEQLVQCRNYLELLFQPGK